MTPKPQHTKPSKPSNLLSTKLTANTPLHPRSSAVATPLKPLSCLNGIPLISPQPNYVPWFSTVTVVKLAVSHALWRLQPRKSAAWQWTGNICFISCSGPQRGSIAAKNSMCARTRWRICRVSPSRRAFCLRHYGKVWPARWRELERKFQTAWRLTRPISSVRRVGAVNGKRRSKWTSPWYARSGSRAASAKAGS